MLFTYVYSKYKRKCCTYLMLHVGSVVENNVHYFKKEVIFFHYHNTIYYFINVRSTMREKECMVVALWLIQLDKKVNVGTNFEIAKKCLGIIAIAIDSLLLGHWRKWLTYYKCYNKNKKMKMEKRIFFTNWEQNR